jgi:hypothetical protein
LQAVFLQSLFALVQCLGADVQDAGGSYLWEPLSIDKLQEFFFLRIQLVQQSVQFLTGKQATFRCGGRAFLQGEKILLVFPCRGGGMGGALIVSAGLFAD